MEQLRRTVFYEQHLEQNAKMVDFGGWEMPIQYSGGIIHEHMATREKTGIFDVSHMGRVIFSGLGVLPFLQHVLTNNARALRVGESQYTLIQNANGGALDDAYLYRFKEGEYLLVVNASNREKDLAHFSEIMTHFNDVSMVDKTFDMAMISVQGPESKGMVETLLTGGNLPEPLKNSLSIGEVNDSPVCIARTGYTGEPLGFELFVGNDSAAEVWSQLLSLGAVPIGLGARDTLRLEACMPLYGHELGSDKDNHEIPIFASKLSRFAVSFSTLKGDFIGKKSLESQHQALSDILMEKAASTSCLSRMIMPLAITGKGIAREGYPVYKGDKEVGYITSGTMVPYRSGMGSGLTSRFEDQVKKRAVSLAYLDSTLKEGECLEIQIRKKRCECVIVPYHMSGEAPPFVRSIPHDTIKKTDQVSDSNNTRTKVLSFVKKAITNHNWRQNECINLIPSEQSQSRLSKMLSITDPVNRYAEHKEVKAFSFEDVFYYQGTSFIEEVEFLLNEEFKKFFGCRQVESRVISGQMANTAFFSALVDYINRVDRKSEQRRIRKILNNHIIKGGHLSAQPMGALRDFVARDLHTEKPAVVNFPVLRENPYKIDIEACRDLVKEHKPELVILGKSMILHREPVSEIRALVDEYSPDCIVMYDMAHVLGLYGGHFQDPLKEGAHIITGSTHKTFFGTQRGVIASDFTDDELNYELWEAVKRRTFPGSVSNHHLGTMTGLLMAVYEMNTFKDQYQKKVIENAKCFAEALHAEGLDVAGDPDNSYTETHQVILNVGYGTGASVAEKLEENNIIVNYQATPEEEGFTASGALRMGVSEMTRFGMECKDFQELAGLMGDVIIRGSSVKKHIVSFREKFLEMEYCFKDDELEDLPGHLLKCLNR